MSGEDEKRKGVTRRKFLAATTGGAAAAATLLHTQGAFARTGKAVKLKPKATNGGASRGAAGRSGNVFHGSPAITELSSQSGQGMLADTSSPMGRMFPNLPAYNPTDQALTDLAAGIPGLPGDNPDNPAIPAGFTFLGQFIDHDVTFDEVSALLGSNDPNDIRSSRSARFDLDSVYGGGPDGSPQLYNPADPKKFLITITQGIEDLPRESSGKAIIADPRNDMHKIIVHVHIAFAKFHNAVVDLLRSQGTVEDALFAAAQQMVRWHYQWVVAHEYLPRVVGQDIVNSVLVQGTNGLPQVVTQFYQPTVGDAFMPIEFSAAAFRFAHSMVRATYRVNETRSVPLLVRLAGGSPITQGNLVFLGNFFVIPGSPRGAQPSKRIDGRMSLPLADLPASITGDALMKNLAERNLRRGKSFGLPSGQQVAAFMGAQVLTNEEIGLTDPGLQGEAPLWFYILKEAEIQQDGRRLGEVGGRIVAEVLLGMLAADPSSYLNAAPTFLPVPPIASSVGNFKMADLVTFAGVPA